MTVFTNPISELPRLHKNRRQALDAAGAKAIPEVPVDFSLTERQAIVRDAVVNSTEYISYELSDELYSIDYSPTWPSTDRGHVFTPLYPENDTAWCEARYFGGYAVNR